MAIREYLRKQSWFDRLIYRDPEPDLQLVIVIPSYNESGLRDCISHLVGIERPGIAVEVLVVINHSESADSSLRALHFSQFEEMKALGKQCLDTGFHLETIFAGDLPTKGAGVGLARKIGMDEAARRLQAAGNARGIIACYDADCTCSDNYLKALAGFFDERKEQEACSIKFSHPLEDAGSMDARLAIVDYELHLRYYIEAQRFAGFPFAFHTIGSSMAVRADTYARVGGMNRRQAGEDFYFLHKCIERGNFGELNSATVFPSPRISVRVPFGTGTAMGKQLLQGEKFLTYPFDAFVELQHLFLRLDVLHSAGGDVQSYLMSLPESLREFCLLQKFEEKVEELRANTSDAVNFKKRFFRWFNAFLLMKYLHFRRDRTGESESPAEAAAQLLLKGSGISPAVDAESLLMEYRNLQSRQWAFDWVGQTSPLS